MSQEYLTQVNGTLGVGDGAQLPFRADKNGALVITGGHAFYHEIVSRGNVYVASNAVAGVAPGTALSTAPPICLHNPVGSGKNLVILKTSVSYLSGTLGGGNIAYGYVAQSTAPSTGAALTPVCLKLGAATGQGKAYTGSTTAQTLLLKSVFTLGAALATSVAFASTCVDLVDGEIVVPPGYLFSMEGIAAAGTSPKVIFSITWEEVTAS